MYLIIWVGYAGKRRFLSHEQLLLGFGGLCISLADTLIKSCAVLCCAVLCCAGYHYDWTARRYRPEPGWHAAFPAELKALCETIGASVGQPLVAEGGIVNYYYTPRGFMGGHKDDLEYTFAAPVVSISLGCSAVFLLGGQDKSVEPVPLLLRSGDVMVMGGDSRLCIHGE